MSAVQKIKQGESITVTFDTPRGWKLEEGESILVNGICSTAINFTDTTFDVEYMPETLQKTTFDTLAVGQKVNLERSLTPNDLMGGHIIYGHIDTTGTVKDITKQGDSQFLKVAIDKEWTELIVDKGSIAIDGISLTVVEVGKDWFTISLINHTIENTNLADIRSGANLNVEIDMTAKYIKKIIKQELYAKEG